MGQTECVASFTSHGREFTVLHKDSAAYLRADGRMIASLGAGLSADEAIAQSHLHAELFQINEREQEAALLHRLYEKPHSDEVKAIAADYLLLKLSPAGKNTVPGDAVYAAFNHNSYAYTPQGWVFLGCFESAQQLQAHAFGIQTSDSLVLASCKPVGKWPAVFKKEGQVIAYTTVGLAVTFALAYGVQYAFNRWPITLPLLMGVIFIGCAGVLWKKK
jgi:hypothetical protein